MNMKTLKIARAAFAALGMMMLGTSAHAEVANGIDWSYRLESGKAVITGCGNLSDGRLRIPEKIGGLAVAKLGAYAFTNRQDITFIEVPDSLESFGLYGFYDCTNITGIAVSTIEKWLSINVPLFSNPLYQAGDLYVGGRLFTEFVSPKGMASIPSCIFSGCTSLRKVVLREGVRDIEIRAFECCYNLEEVDFPESLESVGIEAFCYCETLESVSFGNRIRKIEDGAFSGCDSLAFIDFPSVEKYLSVDTYYAWWGPAIYIGGKPLVNLVIPDGTAEIRDGAFCRCPDLKTVVIPDSVQVIGQDAFSENENLVSVTFGKGIREVCSYAFYGCTSFERAIFPGGAIKFESSVFLRCTSLREVRIPEGTERIEGGMFEDCKALAAIEFPETIRRISGYAFDGCDALRELVFPESFDFVDNHWSAYTNLTSLVFRGAPPFFEDGDGDYFAPLFWPNMPVTVPEEFADEWNEFFVDYGLQNPVILSPSPGFQVDNVIASQRYPWNGFVDIEFDLDVDGGAADTYSLSFNVLDGADVSVTNFVQKCRAGHVVVSVDLSSCLKGEEDVYVSIGRPRAFCDLACSDWLYYRPVNGTILLDEDESELDIAYDCRWGSSDACELRINGATIDEALGPCGIFTWLVPDEPASYKLELICGDVTLTRYVCRPDPEAVEVHWNDTVCGGETNVWSSDVVHVVCGWGVCVEKGGTLLIEPGAVVKFMPGSGLEICSDGVCVCDGAILTHVADDTIGGDTLGDGVSTLPKKGEYAISGPLTYDSVPDVRYFMRIVERRFGMCTIDEDEIWEGFGTYRIKGDLFIDDAATLTIKPGTRLEFEPVHIDGQMDSEPGVTVYGKLSAVGTSARPIVFTSANEIPQPGDWWGINVDGIAEFEHCRIEYAAPGNERGLVNNYGGEAVLRKCFLAHAQYDGVWSWDESASTRLEDCVITDCGNAACAFLGDIELVNCTIAGCNNVAMYWEHWEGSLDVQNCVISEMGIGWVDTNDGHQFNIRNKFENCLFYNPAGFALQNCEKTGVDGNIWGDPQFVNAEAEDFRILAGSAARDAANVKTATKTDYNDTPRDERPDLGAFECDGDARYAADLVPVRLEVSPEVAIVGGSTTFSWQTANVGTIKSGERRDALYLESASGASLLVGEVVVAGLQAGTEALTKASFTLPAMSPGRWTPKVVVNAYHDAYEGTNTQNNALRGEAAVEVTIPYATAEDCVGMLPAEGVRLLRLKTDPARQGLVAVKVSEGMRVSFGRGFVPSANNASQTALAAGGIVYFAVPKDGSDVYVLLEDEDGGTFDVSQVEGSAAIGQVKPSQIPPNGTSHLTVTGAGFDANSAVRFVCGNETVVPEEIRVVDSSTIVLTVDGSRTTPGKAYDLIVETASGDIRADGAVSVRALRGKGEFWAKLIVPPVVRQGRKCACYVEYGNSGTADVGVQVLRVDISGGGKLGRMNGSCESDYLNFMAAGEAPMSGVIRPGYSSRVSFVLLAGAENRVALSSSRKRFERDSNLPYDGYPPTAIADAASRLSMRGGDPTDYLAVMQMAENTVLNVEYGCVVGFVRTQENEPVADAVVEFTREEECVLARTDKKGRYCIEPVLPGSYRLAVKNRTVIRDIEPVVVKTACDAFADTIIVSNGCSLVVNLLSGDNDTVSVTIERFCPDDVLRDGILPVWQTQTRAVFDGLSAGEYVVTCLCADGVTISRSVDVDAESIAVCDVDALPRSTALIQLNKNEPSDCVSVLLFDDEDLVRSELRTTASELEFIDLPDGEYILVVMNGDGSTRLAVEMFIVDHVQHRAQRLTIDCTSSMAKDRLLAKSAAKSFASLSAKYDVDEIDDKTEKLLKRIEKILKRPLTPPKGDYDCEHNQKQYAYYKGLVSDLKDYSTALRNELYAYNAGYWLNVAANMEIFLQGTQAAAEACLIKILGPKGGKIAGSAWGALQDAFLRKADKGEWSASEGERIVLDILIGSVENFDPGVKELAAVKKFYNYFSIALKKSKAATKMEKAAAELNKYYSSAEKLADQLDVILTSDGPRYILDDCKNKKNDLDEEDVNEPDNPTSEDPNEIAGPAGTGADRAVKPGDWMTYTIFFENKSDAANAAQEVWVTNPLSPWLDWSTFEVIDVSFADQVDLGLAGLHRGTSLVDLNGTDYKVQTTLSLDKKSGVADWYLRIVDESTDTTWPDDVFAGFLLPNDSTTHCGEGHLTYRIKVREDAPSGARIENAASIVFDYNDPIETDPDWWNTIRTEQITYTVTFDANGGTGEMPAQVFTNGVAQALATNCFTFAEREFVGWATNADSEVIYTDGAIVSNLTVVGGTFALFAKWTGDELVGPGVIVDPTPSQADLTPVESVTSALAYNGYVVTGTKIAGLVTVKVAKGGRITAMVQLPASDAKPFSFKKYTFKGVLGEGGSAELVCAKYPGGEMAITVCQGMVSGTVGSGAAKLELTARLGTKDALANVDILNGKVWTVALEAASTKKAGSFLNGYSSLSVSAAKKGKVKVKGVMVDGTKVSVSAQGMAFDDVLIVPVNVPLYKGKVGGFSMKLKLAKDSIEVGNLSEWYALENETTVSAAFKSAPAAVASNVEAGVAFLMDAKEAESLVNGLVTGSEKSILPNGVPVKAVDASSGKWTLPKAGKVALVKGTTDLDETKFTAKGETDPNPAGLKLTFKKKTGLFSGSFQFYQQSGDKLKKLKAAVNGAVVDGKGYGSATVKNMGALPVTVGK